MVDRLAKWVKGRDVNGMLMPLTGKGFLLSALGSRETAQTANALKRRDFKSLQATKVTVPVNLTVD